MRQQYRVEPGSIASHLVAVNQKLAALVDRLLPQDCLFCLHPGVDSLPLCAACQQDLPPLNSACPRCAIALPEAALCGQCQQKPPPFDRAIAAYHYGYPLDWLVQRMKFSHRRDVAHTLALLMQRSLRHRLGTVDAIVPVPLHPTRQRQRKFNQAERLARPLQAIAKAPLQPLLRRRVNTPAQSTLPKDERSKNVRNAFEAVGPVPTRVAVVDDVMTSGATVAECARQLKRAGAQWVEVWTLARA